MLTAISDRVKKEEICCKRKMTLSLLDYANENRGSGLFDDVIIMTDNESFPASRLVLSCFSPYFKKMFKTEMKEKYEKTIEIKDIDKHSMKNLLDFIYTGLININGDNVCQLLTASDYLQLDDAKQFCFDFLKEALLPDNCFVILTLIDYYNNDNLKNDINRFIGENLSEIACSDDFKKFTLEKLVSFVLNQDRSFVQESSVYTALIEWTKYDKNNRVVDFPDLLKYVDLYKLSFEFLENVVLYENLVLQCNTCLRLVNTVLTNQFKKYRLKDTECKILQIGEKQELQVAGSRKVTTLYSISGNGNDSVIAFPDLLSDHYGGCAAKLDDFILVVDGHRADDARIEVETAWKLNLKKEQLRWEEIAPMNERRQRMSAAVFKNNLVVFGGLKNINKKKSFSSGEMYSLTTNSWKYLPSMQEPRCAFGLVVCKDVLYAFGGNNGKKIHSSGEHLSQIGDKWEYINSMQTSRFFAAAVNCNDVIYAIGGKSGIENATRLKSVEVYDTTKDEWSYISDMNFVRSGCSACVLQGRIFVFGGVDNFGNIVNEIECYDPLIKRWNIVGKINGIQTKNIHVYSLVVI